MENTSVPPSNPAEAAAPAPAPADLNALAQESQEVLGDMLRLLTFQAKLCSTVNKDTVRIQLECEDPGRIIGRRGITVNQLQYLLNRILQRRHTILPRIYLDVAGHGEKSEKPERTERVEKVEEKVSDQFRQKMRDLADQVRRWGQAVELGTLKPVEQKSVQDLFDGDRELEVVNLESSPDPEKPQRMQLRVKEKAK